MRRFCALTPKRVPAFLAARTAAEKPSAAPKAAADAKATEPKTPAAGKVDPKAAVPKKTDNVAEAMASYAASGDDPTKMARHLTMVHEVMPNVALGSMITGTAGWMLLFGLPPTPYHGLAWAAGITAITRALSRGIRSFTPKDMTGKICVVTGGSSGLGQCTAAHLASMGATVVVTCHSVQPDQAVQGILDKVPSAKREEVEEKGRVIAWPMTLEDRISVTKFVNTLKSTFPQGVDVLVNCAGVMMEEYVANTRNGHELSLDANFLGTFQLTELAMPLIAKRGGRVVQPVSHGHRIITTRRGTLQVAPFYFGQKFETTVTPAMRKALAQQKKTQAATAAATGTAAGDAPSAKAEDKKKEKQAADEELDEDDDYFEVDEDYNQLRQFYAAHFGRVAHVQSLAARGGHVVAVCPGRCMTNLRRLMFPQMTTYSWLMKTLFMRTAEEGSWGITHACIVDDAKMAWGGYYYRSVHRPGAQSRWVNHSGESVIKWAEQQIPSMPMWKGTSDKK